MVGRMVDLMAVGMDTKMVGMRVVKLVDLMVGMTVESWVV